MISDLTCGKLRETGAELALGVLPGRERADAVAHLDRCAECREYVGHLTLVGDGLVGLLPDREPPLGFETRVARLLIRDVMTHEGRPRPGGVGPAHQGLRGGVRRMWLRVAALATAYTVATGFAGWAVGAAFEELTAGPPPASEPMLVGDMTSASSAGQPVGEVYARPGDHGWIFMAVDLDGSGTPYSGRVTCVLERPDGTTVRVGHFALRDGMGQWGVTAHVNPAVLAARLISPDGTVLARAHLQTGHVITREA
ncbi:hypothetical protein [Streptomyces sp. NPDC006739]|uniref:hypothetical protein n=1 Tax=Streptomyces sp. NPDC006739 TaxID=3364763 RepID=UPI0036BB2D2F